MAVGRVAASKCPPGTSRCRMRCLWGSMRPGRACGTPERKKRDPGTHRRQDHRYQLSQQHPAQGCTGNLHCALHIVAGEQVCHLHRLTNCTISLVALRQDDAQSREARPQGCPKGPARTRPMNDFFPTSSNSTEISAMSSARPPCVPLPTSEQIDRRIQEQVRCSVTYYSECSAEQVDRRLQELDEEWDVERALQLSGAGFATGAVALGLFGKKRWLLLAGLTTAFLAQQALRRWCPPVAVLRQLGFRTASEIEQERYALKALRGDPQARSPHDEPDAAEQVNAALEAAGET